MAKNLILSLALTCVMTLSATAQVVTDYSWTDCQGTYMPYPTPTETFVIPDTLRPVMINHVGRHGARYPSSSKASEHLRRSLIDIADNAGGLSQTGRDLLAIVDSVLAVSSGRWGALSQLGAEEQRGIAKRMIERCRPLFNDVKVNAISSWSPRCIMSMYEFTHQLSTLDTNIEVTTNSGSDNSPLLRFFDDNARFNAFLKSEKLKEISDTFDASFIPLEPFLRLMAHPERNPYSLKHMRKCVTNAWAVLTGMTAYGLNVDPQPFFTHEEQNRLWEVANMKHYLRRSASTLSAVPADIAAPLLENIIATFDAFVSDSASIAPVQLRFGHAETLMPLVSLMRLVGCRYLTGDFDTVGFNWRDFQISPMAANLQLILLRSVSGRLYLITLLNERPVSLDSDTGRYIIRWDEARSRLRSYLPPG